MNFDAKLGQGFMLKNDKSQDYFFLLIKDFSWSWVKTLSILVC